MPMTHHPHFMSLTQLAESPQPQWLIEGICEVNSLVMLAGPPASYKSFLALDWMLSMSSWRGWNTRKVKPSRALYLLGEGRASLYKRIMSWVVHHKLAPPEIDAIEHNFRVGFEVPQMASKSSVDTLLAHLSRENFNPDVVVLDTFARSSVGLDENSQRDTGLWVESAERLRALGFTVIFLHHTKKNEELGIQYRGSTAILGAMDTALTMFKKKDLVTVSITKQKDHDEGPPFYFRRHPVVLHEGAEPGCVLLPTSPIDELYADKVEREQAILDQILADPTDLSDRARAKILAERLRITETAAQSRVIRRRKELGLISNE
jgi:hypothetical protein